MSSLRGARVLVVDDDPLNRDLLARSLRAEGCEVTTAEDGLRALRILRSDGPNVDLVLLDVLMPAMDGYEVLQLMRGDGVLVHLPVVVISALDDVSSIVRCIELGADDFLTKPFDPVLLRARLGTSLERKRHFDTERHYLQLIEQEQTRNDRLILNILPRSIAERLKNGESLIADAFGDVSIVFADLVGFTTLAATRDPAEVVALLDALVTRFDQLAIAFGLEKIKTIGDAYLAVGGLRDGDEDHLDAAVGMALEMLEVVADVGDGLQLRVGIHAGPVIAGVIGVHKFSYDLWGDTVNVASRMESHGVPGRVHVTEEVRARLDDRFAFEDRGPIEIRNRGVMKTYLVGERLGAAPAPTVLDLRDDAPLARDEVLRGEPIQLA